MAESFGRIFAKENKWGIILGIIVALIGGISNYFLTKLQFASFILQAITLFLITAMMSNYLSKHQHKTIEASTKVMLVS